MSLLNPISPEPVSTYKAPERVIVNSGSIVITDVDMSVGAMCKFMVKWAIAAIPATIILMIVFAILIAIFGGIFREILK